MFSQFCEAAYYQELLAFWGLFYFFVLEDPGIAVGDENGVQSCGERGIDVGFGTVADHPGGVWIEFEFFHDERIG